MTSKPSWPPMSRKAALQTAVARRARVPREAQTELLERLEELKHVVHAEDGDEVEGQVQVLLHLRAVGVVGDEAAVKLLDARRAEARARVHVHHAVAQTAAEAAAEGKLRLARAGLARELRHLAWRKPPPRRSSMPSQPGSAEAE